MSTKSARLIDMNDDRFIEHDLEIEVDLSSLEIGSRVKGSIFLTTHECPHCHSKMQTLGVGHAMYECSWCAGVRNRSVEMVRHFECMEIEE